MKRLVEALIAAGVLLAVPNLAHAAGGSIKGKVDATPAKYLEETVVYVQQASGTFAPKTLSMDQQGMKFLPHVLAATAGDTVEFLNHDNVDHNVFTPDNEAYTLGTFKQGEKRTHTFAKPGVYSQLCSVHPEMLGFIWVGQNPYHAVVSADGSYEIKDVPAGTYTLAVWNSHLKAATQSVTVVEGKPVTANFSVKR